jgi:hypothetical protein
VRPFWSLTPSHDGGARYRRPRQVKLRGAEEGSSSRVLVKGKQLTNQHSQHPVDCPIGYPMDGCCPPGGVKIYQNSPGPRRAGRRCCFTYLALSCSSLSHSPNRTIPFRPIPSCRQPTPDLTQQQQPASANKHGPAQHTAQTGGCLSTQASGLVSISFPGRSPSPEFEVLTKPSPRG